MQKFTKFHWLIPLSTMAALPLQAQADYRTDVGYARLASELGNGLPTGASVKVTQVEASASSDPSHPIFAPDPGAASLLEKSFSYPGLSCATPPCVPTEFSAHALGSADRFYGTTLSMTPGITNIHSYEVNQWIPTLIKANGSASTSDRRIANHSWAGSGMTPTDSANILRLIDRQVERNEYIQVTAAASPLLADAYNDISVGISAGIPTQSHAIDSVYNAQRPIVDLVAPADVLSSATPIVASAAALLVDVGHSGGLNLSKGSKTVTPDSGTPFTVYNAERSETIKAALLAGADRETQNTTTYGDITDYRAVTHQTANGLDDRYGAGQLNIENSYRIIAAGEQDSLEDDVAQLGAIGMAGFDYNDSFVVPSGSNNIAQYTFTASLNETLSAALVWNLTIDNTGSMTPTLRHLGLSLVDTTNNHETVASSTSLVDNTQNLFWKDLVGGHQYQLQVSSLESGHLSGDYALAWQRSVSATPVPIPAAFWLFGSAIATLTGWQRRKTV